MKLITDKLNVFDKVKLVKCIWLNVCTLQNVFDKIKLIK